MACDRASRTKKSLTLSHTVCSLSLEMQMEEQEARGKRPEQEAGAALASAYRRPAHQDLGGRGAAGLGHAHSARGERGPHRRAQPPRVWSATWRRRQPGGYTVLYVGRGYDGRPAGYRSIRAHVARSILLHSASSPHVGVNTRRHDCVAAVWLAWRKRHAIFERFGALAEQLAVACTAVEPSCAWMLRPAPEENVACSGAPQSKSCSGYRRRDESWSRARS